MFSISFVSDWRRVTVSYYWFKRSLSERKGDWPGSRRKSKIPAWGRTFGHRTGSTWRRRDKYCATWWAVARRRCRRGWPWLCCSCSLSCSRQHLDWHSKQQQWIYQTNKFGHNDPLQRTADSTESLELHSKSIWILFAPALHTVLVIQSQGKHFNRSDGHHIRDSYGFFLIKLIGHHN